MNQDVKKKWVDALRSDEYEKANGNLKKGEKGRCCLGVLCDIYKEEHGAARWVECRSDVDAFSPSDSSDESTALLPDMVVDWAGLSHSGGARIRIEERGVRYTLSELNDGISVEEHSFDEIADIIENNL